MKNNQELVWWYIDSNDQKIGPISKDQLRLALVNGEITIESLVWNNGLAEWSNLKSVVELKDIIADIPPPITSAVHPEPKEEQPIKPDSPLDIPDISSEKPRPWIRLWARSLDIGLFLFLASFILGLTEGLLNVEFFSRSRPDRC